VSVYPHLQECDSVNVSRDSVNVGRDSVNVGRGSGNVGRDSGIELRFFGVVQKHVLFGERIPAPARS
jgi:hypothetical protein